MPERNPKPFQNFIKKHGAELDRRIKEIWKARGFPDMQITDVHRQTWLNDNEIYSWAVSTGDLYTKKNPEEDEDQEPKCPTCDRELKLVITHGGRGPMEYECPVCHERWDEDSEEIRANPTTPPELKGSELRTMSVKQVQSFILDNAKYIGISSSIEPSHVARNSDIGNIYRKGDIKTYRTENPKKLVIGHIESSKDDIHIMIKKDAIDGIRSVTLGTTEFLKIVVPKKDLRKIIRWERGVMVLGQELQ